METVSAATQDDSSGANPSSVKSEDSSPHHEGGRGSPPPNCAICLGRCRNKSFTDSCLHQFCFKCLLTWSKVKTECPLCKQNFRSIIHNVRSNHQYEEYMVEQRQTEETTERIDIDGLATATRRFRYRTTLTLPRRETIAIQQLLLHYPLMAGVFPPAAPAPPDRRRRSPASFRRTVYRHNLWARPLPDFTGRFRDCTPEFYRYNDSQMHRLVPWLNRELHYLLNENIGHISYVMTRILELLRQYHINSSEFREAMHRYFGERTEHFLHELYCFASTPYDMTGYDRNVQYTTDTRISTMVNEVISSSDSEASVDSDIVMVTSSEPAEPPPGPSRLPAPVYPQNYIPQPAPNNVIPIETISQSDTDDDSSEVMVVGYIKPPQERTPEVVDLLGSDSDVILQENTQPEPSYTTDAQEGQPAALVKLTLKQHVARDNGESDSDDGSYRPPPPPSRRKRRPRSSDTATTSDTCRATPSPRVSPLPASPYRSPTASPTTSDTPSDSSSESSSSSDEKRSRIAKKKSKRKTSKETSCSKDRKKNKKRSRTHHKDRNGSLAPQTEKDKRSKRKSHSGKGVKSSKKPSSSNGALPQQMEVDFDQPGTSGTSNNRKRKASRERKRSRSSREGKRLKSVVNVMNSHKRGESSSSRNSSTTASTTSSAAGTSASKSSEEAVSAGAKEKRVKDAATETNEDFSDVEKDIYQVLASRGNGDSSDSDDDLPLNLTVKKSYPLSH